MQQPAKKTIKPRLQMEWTRLLQIPRAAEFVVHIVAPTIYI